MAGITKYDLLKFLEEVNLELGEEIILLAIGGTAMTLLGMKEFTKDVDFDTPSEDDYKKFMQAIDRIGANIRIDVFKSDMILTEILPPDYLKIAIKYTDVNFSKINLYMLHPIDIICSKIARLNDSDIKDIKTCISYYNITKSEIQQRAMQYEHVGSDESYYQGVEYVLKNLF